MIERIIIENFKSIKKLDLELKPINVLVGANGAGKSNLLSFLELVKNTVGTNWIDANYDINKLLYFGRNVSKKLSGEINFGSFYNIKFTIVPLENSNEGRIVENVLRDEREIQAHNDNVDNPFLAMRSEREHFQTYHFHDTEPMKALCNLNDNRYLKTHGENLASYLYYLREKHYQDFQNIENQMRSVAPFFGRFDLEPDRLHDGQIALRWLEKGSKEYFDGYDFSDGTLRYVALVTLLMQPELPKTITIDEPELGLHPFAINKLAAMLQVAAAKGSQVIIATQSTDLISNFDPEDIITVDRGKEQSIFRRLDSRELEAWLEDYSLGELWTKNLIGAMP